MKTKSNCRFLIAVFFIGCLYASTSTAIDVFAHEKNSPQVFLAKDDTNKKLLKQHGKDTTEQRDEGSIGDRNKNTWIHKNDQIDNSIKQGDQGTIGDHNVNTWNNSKKARDTSDK